MSGAAQQQQAASTNELELLSSDLLLIQSFTCKQSLSSCTRHAGEGIGQASAVRLVLLLGTAHVQQLPPRLGCFHCPQTIYMWGQPRARGSAREQGMVAISCGALCRRSFSQYPQCAHEPAGLAGAGVPERKCCPDHPNCRATASCKIVAARGAGAACRMRQFHMLAAHLLVRQAGVLQRLNCGGQGSGRLCEDGTPTTTESSRCGCAKPHPGTHRSPARGNR